MKIAAFVVLLLSISLVFVKESRAVDMVSANGFECKGSDYEGFRITQCMGEFKYQRAKQTLFATCTGLEMCRMEVAALYADGLELMGFDSQTGCMWSKWTSKADEKMGWEGLELYDKKGKKRTKKKISDEAAARFIEKICEK